MWLYDRQVLLELIRDTNRFHRAAGRTRLLRRHGDGFTDAGRRSLVAYFFRKEEGARELLKALRCAVCRLLGERGRIGGFRQPRPTTD